VLRRKAARKILQTPSWVGIALGLRAGEIVVSWTESESDRVWKNHDLIRKGRVTLHRESTCSHMKHEVLSSSKSSLTLEVLICVKFLKNFETLLMTVGEILEKNTTESIVTSVACGCPEQVVALKDSVTTFTGLSHDEQYFPMVSGMAPQSFFGFPPAALRPPAAKQILAATQNADALLSALSSATSKTGVQLNDSSAGSQDDNESTASYGGRGNASSSQSTPSGQSSAASITTNNTTRSSTPASKPAINAQETRKNLINIKLQVRNRGTPFRLCS
jgi:hypothetical protein